MRIRDQVGDGLAIIEQLPECCPMLLGGSNDSCARLIKPALYPGQGLFKGQRMFEYPWICSDPNEGRQDRPAQANRFAP